MSTRALIGRKNDDGTITFVSSTYDGQLYHNGMMLRTFWSDPAKLQQIFDLGNISSLGPLLGEKHDGLKFPPPPECADYTIFFVRDRGAEESENKARTVATVEEFLKAQDNIDYHYLFADGAWQVAKRDRSNTSDLPTLRSLEEALNDVHLTVEILSEDEDGFVLHADFNEDPQDYQEKQATFAELVQFLDQTAEGQWEWSLDKEHDPRIRVRLASAVVALRLRYNIQDHEDRQAAAA